MGRDQLHAELAAQPGQREQQAGRVGTARNRDQDAVTRHQHRVRADAALNHTQQGSERVVHGDWSLAGSRNDCNLKVRRRIEFSGYVRCKSFEDDWDLLRE